MPGTTAVAKGIALAGKPLFDQGGILEALNATYNDTGLTTQGLDPL
jgi:hypothetical protein